VAFSNIPRGPVEHHSLVWITARNRETDAAEPAGFWTGPEDREFTVAGDLRTYFGAGHILQIPPIVTPAGLRVQMQEIQLAATSPEVEAAIRGYDVRHAPVEIHVARFGPGDGQLLGIDRVFRGYVDSAPRLIPAKNQPGARWSMRVASAMRSLTRPLSLTRSDASQIRRSLPGGGSDRFFRFAVVAGRVERFWGMARSK